METKGNKIPRWDVGGRNTAFWDFHASITETPVHPHIYMTEIQTHYTVSFASLGACLCTHM